MRLTFTGRVLEQESADIGEVARTATYGWGVVPVEARIGDITFTTSLFPKDGGYLLPLKNAVGMRVVLTGGEVVRVVVRFGV